MPDPTMLDYRIRKLLCENPLAGPPMSRPFSYPEGFTCPTTGSSS